MTDTKAIGRLDLDACKSEPARAAFFAGVIEAAEMLNQRVTLRELRDGGGHVYGIMAEVESGPVTRTDNG